MPDPCDHACLSAIGTFLSGIGALATGAAALLAVWWAPEKLQQWSARRRMEARAHHASRVLQAALEMIECLRGLRRSPIRTGDEDARAAVESRWAGARAVEREFDAALIVARAHLPDAVGRVLRDVRRLADSAYATQLRFATQQSGESSGLPVALGPVLSATDIDVAYGEPNGFTSRTINDAEAKLIAMLRPLAQLDVASVAP